MNNNEKYDFLNELTGIDDKRIEEISERFPLLDNSGKKRIADLCEEKLNMKKGSYFYDTNDSETIDNIEISKNKKWYHSHIFNAAAMFVITIGIAGVAFSGIKHIRSDNSESEPPAVSFYETETSASENTTKSSTILTSSETTVSGTETTKTGINSSIENTTRKTDVSKTETVITVQSEISETVTVSVKTSDTDENTIPTDTESASVPDFSRTKGLWEITGSENANHLIIMDGQGGFFIYFKDGTRYDGYIEIIDEYGDGSRLLYNMYHMNGIWYGGFYFDSDIQIHFNDGENPKYIKTNDKPEVPQPNFSHTKGVWKLSSGIGDKYISMNENGTYTIHTSYGTKKYDGEGYIEISDEYDNSSGIRYDMYHLSGSFYDCFYFENDDFIYFENKNSAEYPLTIYEKIFTESNNQFNGRYIAYNDDTSLDIQEIDENIYSVTIEIFRITTLEGHGWFDENGIFQFASLDAGGNDIYAEISFNENNAELIFTDSTWGYLQNGTTINFIRQ